MSSSAAYHEPVAELSPASRDLHRALATIIEELEAVDWYQQRADVTPDGALRDILNHHRDEEIEHAVMTLEWVRRRVPRFDEVLRTYLFTDGPITAVEEAHEHGGHGHGAPTRVTHGDLGLASMQKGKRS